MLSKSQNILDTMFESTELHDAILECDVERVRSLLEAGADIEAKAISGTTPLMTACAPHSGILQVATRARAGMKTNSDPDSKQPFDIKSIPVHNLKQMLAEQNKKREYDDTLPPNDPAIPQLLLEKGADINVVDEHSQSALMKAVIAGCLQITRLLLEQGANFRDGDKDDQPPLFLAAQSRRLEAVQLLLEWGADIDYRTPQGNTILMAAAEGGRIEIARLLLTRGQDVNTVGVNDQTALQYAALHGHDAMIALLLEAGAAIGFLEAIMLDKTELARSLPVPELEARGPKWGYASLMWAVKHENSKALHLLLERGASANAVNKSGQSALLSAVMRENIAHVRALLDAGADPNGGRFKYSSPLDWAARRGCIEIMDLLLAHGASVNITKARSTEAKTETVAHGKTEDIANKAEDNQENNALAGAVMFGNLAGAKRLLEAGADPNANVEASLSPLAYATVRADKEMVRLLLDYGALSQRGINNIRVMSLARDKPEIAAMLKEAAGTDLHEMAKEGQTEALLARLDAGANLEARGDMGETLLSAALWGKQTDTALALIERGANVNVVDRSGNTPLSSAALRGDENMVRLLLARGADIAAENQIGQTTLLCAALAGHQSVITLLIEAGARVGPVEAAVMGDLTLLRQLLDNGTDVDTCDSGGMTPLMGAVVHGHTDVLMALLTRRAAINATDERGQTALIWAVAYKQLAAVRILLAHGADVNLAGVDRSRERRIKIFWDGHQEVLDSKLGSDSHYYARAPLNAAALHVDTDIAELLLESGAAVNALSGSAHSTALTTAAIMGNPAMTRLLLERGADMTVVDRMGNTALWWAEQHDKPISKHSDEHAEVVAILKAHLKAD